MNNTIDKYKIKIIRNIDELDSIKSVWYELTKNNHNIHLTYEWVSCWLKCFLNEKSALYIVIVFDKDKPIAIAPFLIKRDNLLFFRYIKIEFISMDDYPDSPTNLCSELDFIIPQANDDILELIINELIKENWNFIRLNPIPSESNTLHELKKTANKNKLFYIDREAFKSLIVNTKTEWDEYKKLISRGMKKELRYHQNKLKELGKISPILLRGNEEINNSLKYILDIEQRSWKWDKGVSINSVKYNNFFQEFPESVSQLGWVHLWFLKLNDEYVAYDFNLCFKDRVICLKGSFDKRYSDYGVGQILLFNEIEYYIKNGFSEFNMLWGKTLAKERWKPINKSYTEVFIFKNDVYSTFLKVLLLNLKFYMIYRIIVDYKNRILRKLKVRTKKSALTRVDQLKQ